MGLTVTGEFEIFETLSMKVRAYMAIQEEMYNELCVATAQLQIRLMSVGFEYELQQMSMTKMNMWHDL